MQNWILSGLLAGCSYVVGLWVPVVLVLVAIVWWFSRETPDRLVRHNARVDRFTPPPDAPVSYGPFTEAERREVEKMEKKIFKYTIGSDLPEFYTLTERFGIVAKIQGRMVGFALVKKYLLSGFLVEEMAVHPNARRRGIGRQMMQA